jgi:hypothetical protein
VLLTTFFAVLMFVLWAADTKDGPDATRLWELLPASVWAILVGLTSNRNRLVRAIVLGLLGTGMDFAVDFLLGRPDATKAGQLLGIFLLSAILAAGIDLVDPPSRLRMWAGQPGVPTSRMWFRHGVYYGVAAVLLSLFAFGTGFVSMSIGWFVSPSLDYAESAGEAVAMLVIGVILLICGFLGAHAPNVIWPVHRSEPAQPGTQ